MWKILTYGQTAMPSPLWQGAEHLYLRLVECADEDSNGEAAAEAVPPLRHLRAGLLASLALDPGICTCFYADGSLPIASGTVLAQEVLESRCVWCAGLNPLVPYLTQMMAEGVQKALKSLPRLRLLLQVWRVPPPWPLMQQQTSTWSCMGAAACRHPQT